MIVASGSLHRVSEHLDAIHKEQYLPETYLIIIGTRNISILYYVAIEFLAFSWYNECR